MENRGLKELFTWKQLRELTSVHVEKVGLNWRAKLVVLDRQGLLDALKTLLDIVPTCDPTADLTRGVYTSWLKGEHAKKPLFSVDSESG